MNWDLRSNVEVGRIAKTLLWETETRLSLNTDGRLEPNAAGLKHLAVWTENLRSSSILVPDLSPEPVVF